MGKPERLLWLCALNGALQFSKIALSARYHQLELHPEGTSLCSMHLVASGDIYSTTVLASCKSVCECRRAGATWHFQFPKYE